MKKVFMLALVGIVLSVASYGVYKSQSSKETMSDFMLANVEALTVIEIGDIEYPEDPNKGKGENRFRRNERNYCEYSYTFFEYFNGNNYFDVSMRPTTSVDCEGTGVVKCYLGVYYGETYNLGKLTEEQMRSLGINL